MFRYAALSSWTLLLVIGVTEAWPSSLRVLRRELALQACGEVALTNRMDCGYTESAEDCYTRGCCWQPARGDAPWCYQPLRSHLDGCVDTPCNQRQACGGPPDVETWQQCIQLGCCWVPTREHRALWCFKRLEEKSSSTMETTKPTTPIMTTTPPADPFRNCQDAHNKGHISSGIYQISLDSGRTISVYCEQELDGGGWTVLQQRVNGKIDFYRGWNDYKNGFGDLNVEFWLGNDNIHLLTLNHDQKVKIELITPANEIAYADYGSFWIENEEKKYLVNISGFSGADPPGDSFLFTFGGKYTDASFSTLDKDNDYSALHCAQVWKGAWWYTSSAYANLNGLYNPSKGSEGIGWYTWKRWDVSMKSTRMMIKTK